MMTEREHDQLVELVFKGVDLLNQEFASFAKSAADSMRVDELNTSIRALTEQVQTLPKSDIVHFRKVNLSEPPGTESAMAELRAAMRAAGFRGV